MTDSLPIHQVRSDGVPRLIGRWWQADRAIELVESGYPLLKPGRHAVPGELPWVFWDMCPSGFLGREFATAKPSLRLPNDPRIWQASDALRALTEGGDDLTGNLIIGDRALAAWAERKQHARPSEIELGEWIAGVRNGEGSSSLGGERPKLALTRGDGSGLLIKYSPPRDTVMGQRWSDLLRVEQHCASTLATFGVAAVDCSAGYRGDRTGLVVSRFDRLAGWGRRGAVTLYWLALERHGDVRLPAPSVVQALVDDGHLPAEAAHTVAHVHAFSKALGNDDTHLGNYGLVFDDDGKASLAPFFDILPMSLAPRHDELPDARLAPQTADWAEPIRSWMSSLIAAVDADADISAPFKSTWHALIGG